MPILLVNSAWLLGLMAGVYAAACKHQAQFSSSAADPVVASAGVFTPGSGPSQREPNSLDANFPVDCAAANYTSAYGAPSAWGWADDKCSAKHIFMCRNACEFGMDHSAMPAA